MGSSRVKMPDEALEGVTVGVLRRISLAVAGLEKRGALLDTLIADET
jgi:hypothetical protein